MITYEALLAWGTLRGRLPTPWEVRTLRAMDVAYNSAAAESDDIEDDGEDDSETTEESETECHQDSTSQG